MACFLVPAAEAVVATAAYVIVKNKEKKIAAPKLSEGRSEISDENKISWSRKLSWLLALLWGGVILLAFEHFWHGEIVPYPPFLSAMSDPADAAEMFHEMATVGVSMALAVTAVWGVVCAAADALKKKAVKAVMEN